ncbi:MAG: hypothetical protein HDP34_03850, partial [Clostridia bacterium]|nr:hypothetical protein [Clostridia bacterium]
MKKIFAILAVIIIACLALTGCVEIDEPPAETTGVTEMYITINGNKLEVALADNSSVAALVERLKQGDVTYTANDYGGFEKVGSLGFSLPTNNSEITTEAGDVILYSGN